MFRVSTRFLYSNLRSFTVLEELNAHLAKQQYAHTLVYFRASWNPQCEIADQQLNQLAAKNRFLEVIKVDSDIAPKIARHYQARTEPEFIFCLFGDEVLRQIGPNEEGLETKLSKMVKLGEESDGEQLAPSHRWMPYGTRF